jgi:hypothetical protein
MLVSRKNPSFIELLTGRLLVERQFTAQALDHFIHFPDPVLAPSDLDQPLKLRIRCISTRTNKGQSCNSATPISRAWPRQ